MSENISFTITFNADEWPLEIIEHAYTRLLHAYGPALRLGSLAHGMVLCLLLRVHSACCDAVGQAERKDRKSWPGPKKP